MGICDFAGSLVGVLPARDLQVSVGGLFKEDVDRVDAREADGDGEVGKLVFSGELILLDLPKYYKRKIKVCKNFV